MLIKNLNQLISLAIWNHANILNIWPLYKVVPFPWLQLILPSSIHRHIKQMPGRMNPCISSPKFTIDLKADYIANIKSRL